MGIPRGTGAQLLVVDEELRGKDLERASYPINLVCPVAAPLLYTIEIDKTEVIVRLEISLMVKGLPATGGARLWLADVNNPIALDGGENEGQVLAHVFLSGGSENKTIPFYPAIIYLDKTSKLFLFLKEDLPAGTEIQGVLTLFTDPTYR